MTHSNPVAASFGSQLPQSLYIISAAILLACVSACGGGGSNSTAATLTAPLETPATGTPVNSTPLPAPAPSPAPATVIAPTPTRALGAVYGMDGYTACIDDNFATSKYFRTVDLGTTPTHVAMVIGGKTYYVFNKTGKVQITHSTFGVSGVYELDINKPAYCKVVKADTAASEATMLSASLTALKLNLNGTTVLTAEQINDQTSLITSALPALVYSQTLLAQAIDLVDTYDSKKGGDFC